MVVVEGRSGGGAGTTESRLAGLSELWAAPAVRSMRCNVLLKALPPLPATSFSLLLFYQPPSIPFYLLSLSLPPFITPLTPRHHHHFIIPHQTSIFNTLLSICDSPLLPDPKIVPLPLLPPPSYRLLPSCLRLNSGLEAFSYRQLGLLKELMGNRGQTCIHGNQIGRFTALCISWLLHCRHLLLANPGRSS